MEKIIREGDEELTIFYKIVRKFCQKCGAQMLHEQGNYIKNGVKVNKVWACIRCGRITQERLE
jgi:DNA-directed RNA polymerase subunit M/transcription elongation factor TFIIS